MTRHNSRVDGDEQQPHGTKMEKTLVEILVVPALDPVTSSGEPRRHRI